MSNLCQLRLGEPRYPGQVAQRMGDDAPRDLYLLGVHDLPSRVDLALVCSVSCPGSVIIKTYDAIRSLRDRGVVVAGGFHSPMERECLDFLIRGTQPVVVSPAIYVGCLELTDAERRATDERRLVLVSVDGPEVIAATRVSALRRNAFVAALADALFVPHAVAGGQAELIARQAIARGQAVLTFDDRENSHLLDFGARPLAPAGVQPVGNEVE